MPSSDPVADVAGAVLASAGELAGNLKLVKVNADDNPEVSRRFEVQSIPTLVLLDHGQVVDKQIGALPEPRLRSWLEANLPETRRLATEANRELRSGAETCPTPPVAGADLGLVGTAVDYLLRSCLRVTSVEQTVASRAVRTH